MRKRKRGEGLVQEILILVALGTERWEERRVQTKYCISEKPGDKGVLF